MNWKEPGSQRTSRSSSGLSIPGSLCETETSFYPVGLYYSLSNTMLTATSSGNNNNNS